jgi:uracil-DNA glycosylase
MADLTNLNQQIIACRLCPRLVAWREQVAREKRRAYLTHEYWGKPVPGFGDISARILVVGLAPGAHGSNRTGRMFTGDASGEFLYPALHQSGFANQPTCVGLGDGLTLSNLFISAVCRCVPPDNKPTTEEIQNCIGFLQSEMDLLPIQGIVALGKIAFDEVVKMTKLRDSDDTGQVQFSHMAFFPAKKDRPWILASYHPSRQNTQTGRLTRDMFQSIWVKARELVG